MKVETEVRICDVCDAYFQIWWKNDTNSPDYKVSYLGHNVDFCPNCYENLVDLCKRKVTR